MQLGMGISLGRGAGTVKGSGAPVTPTNPTTLWSDTFTGTTGAAVDAGYIVSGGTWVIDANRARNTTVAGASRLLRDVATPDCTLQVTFAVVASLTKAHFRYTDINNEWVVSGTAGASYVLAKKVAGSTTVLGTINTVPANGDKIFVRMSGPQIDFYLNDTFVYGVTDTFNQTATLHGFGTASTATPCFDNLDIKTLT